MPRLAPLAPFFAAFFALAGCRSQESATSAAADPLSKPAEQAPKGATSEEAPAIQRALPAHHGAHHDELVKGGGAAQELPKGQANSGATNHLGAPFRGRPVTTLASLSTDRLKFKNDDIATTGTIKAVCQEMGCWMEIVDGKTNAIVRMHDHAFFIPKTASGRSAKVEGKLVLVKDGKECDEANAKDASLQIDATGVDLM